MRRDVVSSIEMRIHAHAGATGRQVFFDGPSLWPEVHCRVFGGDTKLDGVSVKLAHRIGE